MRGTKAPGRKDTAALDAVEASERHLMNWPRRSPDAAETDVHFRLTRSIITAGRRWRKVANERLKESGQTMARWETLFLVAYADGAPTQGELARAISVEGPTMVRMLDQLARDGLITRENAEADRRITINRITPAGTDVINRIMGTTNMLRAEVVEGLPREKVEIALEVLEHVMKKLDDLR